MALAVWCRLPDSCDAAEKKRIFKAAAQRLQALTLHSERGFATITDYGEYESEESA